MINKHKNKSISLKIIFGIIFISNFIFSGQGSAGAKFLQINNGSHGMANGGSLIARPGLLEAVYYNPASIASIKNAQFYATHIDYYVDLKFEQVSFAYKTPFGSFSVALYGLLSGEMEETTEENPTGTGRMFTANDLAGQFSFAKKFTNKFSGGFTAKYISQSIDKLNSSGLAFDMGALYKTGILNNLVIGFAFRNFGSDMRYTGENLQQLTSLTDNVFEDEDVKIELSSESYSLPTAFELGFSMEFNTFFPGEIITSASLHNIVDQSEYFSFGIEYHYFEYMYFALGHGNITALINSDLSDEDLNGNMRGISGGVGLNLKPVFNQSIWLTYAFEGHKYFNPIHSFGVTIHL